jgi:hypothetical protein
LYEDFESFGLPQDLRDQILRTTIEQETPADFVVMPEAAPALDVFLFCQTQWRTAMSGVTGLDYTAVIAVIKTRFKKSRQRRQILEDVRLIESGALAAISKARVKNG